MKVIFLVLSLSISLLSAEYAVVVNENTKVLKVSKKQLKDIFIMKRHFVNNQKLVPVNLSSSSKVRDRFEKVVLKLNREKLNNYWIKKHFQGVRPPVVQSSSNSMKLFIKNVDGAIGYLPISAVDADLRVVFEF